MELIIKNMDQNESNQLPTDIQKAIDNADVYTALKKIGDEYGLMIDQLGTLDRITRQVLIGKVRSSQYISLVAKELEISNQTAEKIAVDVNTQIFAPLRESLRKMQEKAETEPVENAATNAPVQSSIKGASPQTPPPPTAPIEKVGQFTIVKQGASSSPQYNDHTLSKETVLADLENIKQLRPENAENFVEHLISGPVKSDPQVEGVKIPKQVVAPPNIPTGETPPTPQAKKYSDDPYREEV
jgi:hypothetical protein